MTFLTASRSESESPPMGIGERLGHLAWLVEPLAVFAATRLALALLAYSAQVFVPLGDWPGVWPDVTGRRILDGWLRWDSGWYLIVAGRGYGLAPDGSLPPVLPLYPSIVWVLDRLLPFGSPICALLVSNAAFAGALVVVYSLVRRKLDRALAVRATLLLCLFPFSYFYVAAYADAVTLLLAAGAFARLEREDARGAFALAALAALSTPSGQMLWPALLVALLVARRPISFLDGASSLLAPLAVLGFGTYLVAAVGASPSAAASAIAGPVRYSLLRDGLGALNPATYTLGSHGLPLLAALVIGLAALLLVRSAGRLLGVGYAVFALLVILRPLVGGLDALGRDLIVAFPVLVAAGQRLRNPRAETLALVVCALFLGLFTALHVSWYPTDRTSPVASPTRDQMSDAGMVATSPPWRGMPWAASGGDVAVDRAGVET